MSRTLRIRERLIEYLNGDIRDNWIKKGILPRDAGPANTHELLIFYNRATRHGTNTNQLVNVLSKDPNIMKVGIIHTRSTALSGSYQLCIWATQEYVQEQIPDYERGDIVFFDEETKTLDKLIR
jgi:hypothetical protein